MKSSGDEKTTVFCVTSPSPKKILLRAEIDECVFNLFFLNKKNVSQDLQYGFQEP